VAVRDAGRSPLEAAPRAKLIDPFLEKIEELVIRSHGKVSANVFHEDRVVPMGFAGLSGRPGGRWRSEGEVRGRAPPDLSAVDPGAGQVGAVCLGEGPGACWAGHEPVLCVGGVVEVPGGDPDVGSDVADHGGVYRLGVADVRGGPDVSVDRQGAGRDC
jgi:hypothetical protein